MLVAPVVSTFDRQSRQPLVCSALAVAPGVNTRIDALSAAYRVSGGLEPVPVPVGAIRVRIRPSRGLPESTAS